MATIMGLKLQDLASTWDDCLKSALWNTAKGAGVGLLLAVALSTKKAPFMLYCGGLATGYSYVLCEHRFKRLDVAK